MGRTRTPTRARAQEQPQPPPEPNPAGTAALAAALATAAAAGTTALPLIGEAILAAEATRLQVAWAQQAAKVAALIAGLGLPGLPKVPRALQIPQPGVRQRGDVVPGQLARAGYAREYLNRARYLRAAFKRGLEAYRDPDEAKRGSWWSNERRWHALHVEAMRSREVARERADEAARIWGRYPGWYGIDDATTTEDCRECFGKNFDVMRPPARGIPGAVHGKCRCYPGPSHPGAEIVY